jgi:hypothetical protein
MHLSVKENHKNRLDIESASSSYHLLSLLLAIEEMKLQRTATEPTADMLKVDHAPGNQQTGSLRLVLFPSISLVDAQVITHGQGRP